METGASSTTTASADTEVLPGYVLVERLGAGGFGEVWKASAPGGLFKAVKLIYGRVDESRASRELEALDRIKGLNHPFLLSTERIEIVNGSLVIILELAEGNLKELFDHHRQQGQMGIPAPTLRDHLHDAADALDYLWNTQALQHLDIKPENLMLVGGRIKVGDFGLLKQIGEGEATILGGITPCYAAPEVFDGRPCQFSDQYSLAIVYQEMLCGQLPFRGRTTAQLAMQHLHHPPQFDQVPAEQRPILRRALSKKPADRFPSCQALVEALIESSIPRVAAPIAVNVRGSGKLREFLSRTVIPLYSQNTAVLGENDTHPPEADEGHDSATLQISPAPVTHAIGPLEVPESNQKGHRPTLFIGVGGIGRKVLMQLNHELSQVFPDRSERAAFPLLAIDTNVTEIRQDELSDEKGILNPDQSLQIPLRSVQAYRDDGRTKFGTIDKRWFFNVPRSAATEGLRPFGRLAFLDHYAMIRKRIELLLTDMLDAINGSAGDSHGGEEGSKHSFQQPPRVFIVGSICGGTGSGMLNELAYLVRQILKEREISGAEVCGILSHGSEHEGNRRDLRAASAIAFLVEYDHYVRNGNGYPGDSRAGIPEFNESVPPFDLPYVTTLAENHPSGDSRRGINSITNFLLLNTLEHGDPYYDASRRSAPVIERQHGKLRSFGICQANIACCVPSQLKGQFLAYELVKQWMGERVEGEDSDMPAEEPRASKQEIEHWTQRSLGPLGEEAADLTARLQEDTTNRLGIKESKLIRTSVRKAISQVMKAAAHGNPREVSKRMLAEVDRLITEKLGLALDLSAEIELKPEEQKLVDQTVSGVTEWLRTLIDTLDVRVVGALESHGQAMSLLRKSAKECQVLITNLSDRANGCRDSIDTELVLLTNAAKKPKPKAPVEEGQPVPQDDREPLKNLLRRLEEYAGLVIRARFAARARQLYGMAADSISEIETRIERLCRHLRTMLKRLQVRHSPLAEWNELQDEPKASTHDQMVRLFGGCVTDLVRALDRKLSVETSGDAGRLSSLLEEGHHNRDRLMQSLHKMAQRMVELGLSEGIDGGPEKIDATAKQPLVSVADAIRQAEAPLPEFATTKRLLVMTPDQSLNPQIVNLIYDSFGAPPNIMPHQSLDVTFCCEAQQIDSSAVARTILGDNDQRIELAEKLRTRNDL